jgi:hypothetical protein
LKSSTFLSVDSLAHRAAFVARCWAQSFPFGGLQTLIVSLLGKTLITVEDEWDCAEIKGTLHPKVDAIKHSGLAKALCLFASVKWASDAIVLNLLAIAFLVSSLRCAGVETII